MGIESGKYIGDFEPQFPSQDDEWREGDDHLRLIKQFLINTLPGENGQGFSKEIIVTEDELNRLKGTHTNVQEQFDAIELGYIAKDNGDQEMFYSLAVSDELRVIDDGLDSFSGVTIYGIDGSFKGAFNYLSVNKAIQIFQQGNGPVNSPDTELNIIDGVIRVHANNGHTTLPKDYRDLTTKGYVDDLFTGGGGDFELSGRLTVHEGVTVIGDGLSEFDGVLITYAGSNRGAFFFNEISGEVGLVQRNAAEALQTVLTLDDGHLVLTGNLVAEEDNHLATKYYVDTYGGGSGIPPGDLEITGVLTVHEGIKIIADTLDPFDGVLIEYQGVTRAGFFFNEANNDVGISQRYSDGNIETVLTLNNGRVNVQGVDVRPVLDHDLTTKKYVDDLFLSLGAGDVEINGILTVHEGIIIDADTLNEFDGVVFNYAGSSRGGLFFNEISSEVGLVQRDAGETVQTALTIINGQAILTGNPLGPLQDDHLATKKYVDDQNGGGIPGGDTEITGVLTVHEGIRIIADTADVFDGVTIIYNNTDRGGFFFNEISEDVGLSQRNLNGDLETQLLLKAGNVELQGTAATPALPTHLTTKKYVDDLVSGGISDDLVVGGTITCSESVTINADTSNPFDGLLVQYQGVDRAHFYFNEVGSGGVGHTGITQIKSNGVVGTIATLSDGRINVDGDNTAPVNDLDLANKAYVDSVAGGGGIPPGDLVVDGTLTCSESLSIIADTGNDFDGMVISYQGIDRAAFYYNEAGEHTGITQIKSNGVAGTIATLKDGRINVDGDNTAPVNALDLTNKQYVDGTLVDAFSGDLVVGGTFTAHESLTIVADTGNAFDGMVISHDNTDRALFYFNEVSQSLGLLLTTPAGGTDTMLILQNGRARLSGISTAPVFDNDLVNKLYADELISGDTIIGGKLTVSEGLRIKADTLDQFDGVIIDFNNVDRGSFFFNETNGDVGITQLDGAGNLETVFILNNGKCFINGAQVQTSAQVAASSQTITQGATGSYLDGSGNTITVVDGLITDLGQ